MNDRELLELAAEAAGLYVKYQMENHDDQFLGLKVKPHRQAGRGTAVLWNPLTDDGDALRLAVKLRLRVSTPTAGVKYGQRAVAESQDRQHGVFSNCGDEDLDRTDPVAATRRAIVRAAAAIGGAKGD